MKRPGKKVRCLVATLVMGPPLLWALIVLLLPMDWARQRIVSSLRERTGQDVQLSRVRLRAFGGVLLSDLRFAASGSEDDPWLKIQSLVVDVSARDLVVGRISPTHAELSGVDVRVHRDRDGRLEFEDLFQVATKASAPRLDAEEEPDVPMTYSLDRSSLMVVDDTTDTRLEFSEIQGQGSMDGPVASLDSMTARLNGGTIEVAARLDTGRGKVAMEGEIRAREVSLGVGMRALVYAVPLLAQAGDGSSAQGQLTLDLFLKTSGLKTDALVKNLAGRGDLILDDLSLDNSLIMEEFTRFLPNGSHARLGSLAGTFEVARRRVQTENTVLTVGEVPVNLAGWSDFDGNLNYLVKCQDLSRKLQSLAEKLPSEARELIEELPVEQLDGLVNLELTGTIDRPIVHAGEGSMLSRKNKGKADAARKASERARLKEAGKRFLDRVIR